VPAPVFCRSSPTGEAGNIPAGRDSGGRRRPGECPATGAGDRV